jgi:hypothetical protein
MQSIAFLKCPMKCWLRAANESAAGKVYAERVKAENDLPCGRNESVGSATA